MCSDELVIIHALDEFTDDSVILQFFNPYFGDVMGSHKLIKNYSVWIIFCFHFQFHGKLHLQDFVLSLSRKLSIFELWVYGHLIGRMSSTTNPPGTQTHKICAGSFLLEIIDSILSTKLVETY